MVVGFRKRPYITQFGSRGVEYFALIANQLSLRKSSNEKYQIHRSLCDINI
jgi:hypothetical protein